VREFSPEPRRFENYVLGKDEHCSQVVAFEIGVLPFGQDDLFVDLVPLPLVCIGVNARS